MADSRSTPSDEAEGEGDPDADRDGSEEGESGDSSAGERSTEELRAQVEEQYDFEDFTPEDMKRMSPKEWDAAFDPDSWITGEELMDRVEADIKAAVVRRDVFARIERLHDPDRIVAYSDEGYAVVYGDGSIEGSGTVLRDVKPVVALCSMEEYEPDEMPDGELLPDPMEVPEGSGERGNLMLQLVAGVQVLAGLILLGGGLFAGGDSGPLLIVVGLGFLLIAFVLFFTVANARLSDKFRAEEYRNRLRALGMEGEDRPAFMDDLVEEHPELVEPDDDAESTA
ncbi:DUF7319 domain-containing protein [Haloglomus salinum]|jgi:hypothetical protein|uniref:DUF7319 domain-containing protein n=1 Tax=Haloglomus salinum TaxID=2962673 RepID=UPI0020C976EF|nr:hypothetical protein [Haloglomus salinum]